MDAIAFDPKRGLIFADEDDGKQVWVIDAKTNKIVGSIVVTGAPEFVEYDPITDKLYQNIKVDDTTQVIDPDKREVTAVWKTTPATGPHGLALDSKNGRVFSAGKNGVLVMMDIKTGTVLSSLPVAGGVDQIAYDSGTGRVYCACKNTLAVAQMSKNGFKKVGDYALPAGAHTVAIDPQTHAAWVCYSDSVGGYLAKFQP